MDADELPGDDVVEISSDDGDEDGARDVEYPHFVNDVPTFEARDEDENESPPRSTSTPCAPC